MRNKELKIAENLTIKDWEDLVGEQDKLKINYDDNEKWGLAFHFFEERIRTRYLNPINAILDLKLNKGEGFAVVNLQCSLIETIESFINGWEYKHKPKGWFKNKQKSEVHNNACIFKSFFTNTMELKKMKVDGSDFYSSVRCGLLHETQTKNDWVIRVDKEKSLLIYEEKDYKKIIYRENFQKELENIIAKYKIAIIKGDPFNNITNGIELRKNFIDKMNHICNNS